VMAERPGFLLGGRFPFSNPNLYGDISFSFGRDFAFTAGLRYRIPVQQGY
jgi:hypothetical protein